MDYAYEDTRRDRCLDYTILCVTVHSSIKRYERELNWVFVCCVCFGNVRRKLYLYLNSLWVAINFSFHLHYPFIVLKWMCFHACTQDHALPTCAKPLMVLNWLTSHQQYIFFFTSIRNNVVKCGLQIHWTDLIRKAANALSFRVVLRTHISVQWR